MSRKSKGCILIPIFLSMVFVGLFFAVTDPNSWPTRDTVLAASDMKLLPPLSTVWCESVVLGANHDFFAYKVDNTPEISSKLSRNSVDIDVKFSRRKQQPLEIRYFMLPGSVLNVFVCALNPHAYLRIYQGQLTDGCTASARKRPLLSSEVDSEESEEERHDKHLCQEPIKEIDVPTPIDEAECLTWKPISINVTKGDYFTIFLATYKTTSNRVRMKLSLDRTSYNFNKSRDTIHKCTDGSRCIVPLSFGSQERVIIIIPPEPEAGKNTFDVQSRCYPRIAMFAVLTFALPNIFFALLAYLICKSPIFCSGKASSRQHVSPPLIGRTQTRSHSLQTNDSLEPLENTVVYHDTPPAYEGLYEDPPPPYCSLTSASGNRRSR